MKYFEVYAKCGHVGKGKYTVKSFAVKAQSGKDAAKFVRECPRVKHDYKDAILSVNEITEKRYSEIRENNNNDMYFSCHCIQDQRRFIDTLEIYEQQTHIEDDKENVHNNIYYKKEIVRNPKKFIRNYYMEEELVS